VSITDNKDNEINSEALSEIKDTRITGDTLTDKLIVNNEINSETITEVKEVSALVKSEDNSEGKEEIKSFNPSAIELIKKLNSEGLGNTAIAKELTGKYYTKRGSTNWAEVQVRRVLKDIGVS
jgi:hypothetical protein